MRPLFPISGECSHAATSVCALSEHTWSEVDDSDSLISSASTQCFQRPWQYGFSHLYQLNKAWLEQYSTQHGYTLDTIEVPNTNPEGVLAFVLNSDEGSSTIIMSPVIDDDHKTTPEMPSISQALQLLIESTQYKELACGAQLIVPLALQWRQHWVAVHISVCEQGEVRFSIYDAKPGLITRFLEFLYRLFFAVPQFSLALQASLAKLLKSSNVTGKTHYQSDQGILNNVDCGRWTHLYIQNLVQGVRTAAELKALKLNKQDVAECDKQLCLPLPESVA